MKALLPHKPSSRTDPVSTTQLNSTSSKYYVPLRSPRSQNQNKLQSSASIVTLDEKIGKVISEIKELNKDRANKYGIA